MNKKIFVFGNGQNQCGTVLGILDCGGKWSATPPWPARKSSELSRAARPRKSGGLGRAAAKSVAERSVRRRNKSSASATPAQNAWYRRQTWPQRGHVHPQPVVFFSCILKTPNIQHSTPNTEVTSTFGVLCRKDASGGGGDASSPKIPACFPRSKSGCSATRASPPPCQRWFLQSAFDVECSMLNVSGHSFT
jgi:hypothetical protein